MGGFSSSTALNTYNIPAYDRVTSLPSWMPTEQNNEQQLMEQYRGTNTAYDTSAYDQANESQQSRLLTTALNSGNNAAAEYSNRARQSGGSGLGAGLVKAEASVGARSTAGAMALDKAKYDAEQRTAAATHATQIATTLGTLRDSYLKSLVSYATSEDATMAEYTAKMAALRQTGGGAGGGYNPLIPPAAQIGGNPSSNDGLEFHNYNEYMDYLAHLQRTYGGGGGVGVGGHG
jgi:hypothetical protein